MRCRRRASHPVDDDHQSCRHAMNGVQMGTTAARGRLPLLAAAVLSLLSLSALLLASVRGAQATFHGRNGELLLFVRPRKPGPELLWLSGPRGQRPRELPMPP